MVSRNRGEPEAFGRGMFPRKAKKESGPGPSQGPPWDRERNAGELDAMRKCAFGARGGRNFEPLQKKDNNTTKNPYTYGERSRS